VGVGIAGEIATKLTHEEIGILRRYDSDKNVYLTIENDKTHWTFRFKMINLRNIQKSNKKIPYIDSKKTSLMELFLWDMRSCPKM
jgi:hypothetical protein